MRFTSSHVERNTFLFLPCSPFPCTCSCSYVKPCFLSQNNAVIFCLHRAVVLVFSSKYYEMLDWVFGFYGFHSADDRRRNITFYFSNFRTCSAPEKEVGRWIRKETRNEIKTSTPSEWSYQGGFILSLIYSWDPISDSRAGLLAAISFLIASLFVNVLKLLAMTCLILLYTKGYVWKGNLTQNLNQMYWRSYIFTEKWDGEGFFETTRSSRRATGTSAKVAGERDML